MAHRRLTEAFVAHMQSDDCPLQGEAKGMAVECAMIMDTLVQRLMAGDVGAVRQLLTLMREAPETQATILAMSLALVARMEKVQAQAWGDVDKMTPELRDQLFEHARALIGERSDG